MAPSHPQRTSHTAPARPRSFDRAFVLLLVLGSATGLMLTAHADDLQRGQSLYQERCADCHGPEGKGDGAKAPFSPQAGNLVSAATSAKSDKELLKIIANGKPHTAMPSWDGTLSAEDQEAVLRYIRSLVRFSRPQTPSPPTP